MSHELRLTLPADAGGARDAAVRVRALVAGADGADALACELAVAEAAANVVLHSNGADVFTIVARVHGGRFVAAVCHLGSLGATRPAQMPLPDAEGGRGLALIAACMDCVRHVTHDGEHRVVMARRLTSIPPLVSSVPHSHAEQESSL